MEDLKNIFLSVVKDNYANFNGRARRREFWMFYLAFLIIVVLLSVVGSILGAIAGILGTIIGLVNLVVILGLIIPLIAVGVRRMHDTNKSGWFILIPVYSFILLVIEGDKGDNQYGPDPKA